MAQLYSLAFVTVALFAIVAVLSMSACAPKPDHNVWRELIAEGVIAAPDGNP